MIVSAELRWFWKDSAPAGLDSWFRSGPISPGGGAGRRDEYLLDPSQTDLGFKKRGGGSGVEIKGLIGGGNFLPPPFAGPVQLWKKWTSQVVSIDDLPRIVVLKMRSLRKFDTGGSDVRELALGPDERLLDRSARLPDRGCLVELVRLEFSEARTPWWTFAFEAFGPLDSVQEDLARTARRIAQPPPPSLDGGLQLSYPEWLSRFSTRDFV